MKLVQFEVRREPYAKSGNRFTAASYASDKPLPPLPPQEYSPGWYARISIECDDDLSDEDAISLLAVALIGNTPPIRVEIRSR